MSKNENLKYELETLSSYDPEDLDNPEFEVAYEDESGREGFTTVCCVDVGARGLERINDLEKVVKEASEYLNTNSMTTIGNGSILHQKFKELTET